MSPHYSFCGSPVTGILSLSKPHPSSETPSQSSAVQLGTRSSAWESVVGSSSDLQRPRGFSGTSHGSGQQVLQQQAVAAPPQPQAHHDMPQNWRKRAVHHQQALNVSLCRSGWLVRGWLQ